jgi:hypothetical protein
MFIVYCIGVYLTFIIWMYVCYCTVGVVYPLVWGENCPLLLHTWIQGGRPAEVHTGIQGDRPAEVQAGI